MTRGTEKKPLQALLAERTEIVAEIEQLDQMKLETIGDRVKAYAEL